MTYAPTGRFGCPERDESVFRHRQTYLNTTSINVVDRRRLVRVIGADAPCRAVFQVVPHHELGDTAERLLGGRDLHQHLHAVATFCEHLLQAPDVTLHHLEPAHGSRLSAARIRVRPTPTCRCQAMPEGVGRSHGKAGPAHDVAMPSGGAAERSEHLATQALTRRSETGSGGERVRAGGGRFRQRRNAPGIGLPRPDSARALRRMDA